MKWFGCPVRTTWFACEEPERPPDPYVVWHYHSCRGCLVKIEAQERRFPDDSHVRLLADLLRAA